MRIGDLQDADHWILVASICAVAYFDGRLAIEHVFHVHPAVSVVLLWMLRGVVRQ